MAAAAPALLPSPPLLMVPALEAFWESAILLVSVQQSSSESLAAASLLGPLKQAEWPVVVADPVCQAAAVEPQAAVPPPLLVAFEVVFFPWESFSV